MAEVQKNNINKGKIALREIHTGDIDRAEEYMNFVSALVDEDAPIGLNEKITLERERDFLRNFIARADSKDAIYLTAWDGEKLIGICGIERMEFLQRHMGQMGVVIAKDYRNQGVGTEMIKEALRLVNNMVDLKIVEMIVLSTNERAIKLYKKLGFKEVAKIPRGYEYRGELVDCIVMQHDI
ncbi:MAG: hypothetical protein A7316_03895 [Candidatus Altiarchaeales archaeon WOR_SM1_86-2]|nr:MAG: hypothetical protein A7316_03895 [Candidatus Altiarchaeales archaeon WOR_SM1_86-2]